MRIFENAERLAVRHDEDAKVAAWREQAAALGAPAYRVVLREGLRPLGLERAAPSLQDVLGEPEQLLSAGEVEALIPALRLASNRGFDVDLTPVDAEHHFLVVQGLKPEMLAQARAEGYAPALVQQLGERELQAVLKVPRESGRDGEESLAERLSLELNSRWASPVRGAPAGAPTVRESTKSSERALAMAGFARHGPGENGKSAKKGTLTVILEALGQFCRATLARLVALRQRADQAAVQAKAEIDAEEKRRQRVKSQVKEIADVISEEEARVYRAHSAEFTGQSQDQVDLEVARKMLQAGQPRGAVAAALLGSPDLAKRHPDVSAYVKEAVEKMQKALKAAAP